MVKQKRTVIGFRAVLCVLCTLLVLSCDMGMYESLSRTDRDPYFEIPQVLSAREQYTIIIRWTADEAADEYLLYRAADDSINPAYSLLYRGTDTEYHDVFALDHEGEKYLYRLVKRRGNKIFIDLETPGKTALGAVYGNLQDIQEPNDRVENATTLTYTVLDGNSYYFKSNYFDNVSFSDEDWYKVFIPAHCKAVIHLIDTSVIASSLQHFKIRRLNLGAESIITDNGANLNNNSDEDKWCYFAIVPDVDNFASLNPLPVGCGKFVVYSIRVSSISPLFD